MTFGGNPCAKARDGTKAAYSEAYGRQPDTLGAERMSPNDIKEARRNGYSNWEILSMLIDCDWEYPDAVNQIVFVLKLDKDEIAEMKYDYDTIL